MKYSESVRAIKAFEKKYGIRFNLNMSGKMADIKCLSTSNLCNPFCACRKNNPALICNKCFADSTCSRYAALRTNMERNTEILTSVLIPVEEWPMLDPVEDPIFRFESFGDLVNEIQAQNYMNMARRNPKTRFALWTKNPGILSRILINPEDKPSNLIILRSSEFIDQRIDASRFWFVDKTFTVYRPATIEAQSIDINCGSRNCMSCQRCYHKNTETDIRERLK